MSTAEEGGTLNPDRLRLVTQNFQQLQGLTRAAVGADLLITNLVRLGRDGSTGLIFMIIPALCFFAFLAPLKYAPRYYRWRFGVMEQRTDSANWSFKHLLGVVAVILFFSLTNVFSGLNRKGVDFDSIVFIAVVFLFLFLAHPQLMRLRLPYLVPALMAVAVVTLFSIGYTTGDRQLAWLKALDTNLIPFVLIVMGLGDHILVLRLMPKRVSEDDHDG